MMMMVINLVGQGYKALALFLGPHLKIITTHNSLCMDGSHVSQTNIQCNMFDKRHYIEVNANAFYSQPCHQNRPPNQNEHYRYQCNTGSGRVEKGVLAGEVDLR